MTAEPTNGMSERGLPEPDDWLEWVPEEVQEAMRQPRFRRLTHAERMDVHGARVPAAYLRPKRFRPQGQPTSSTAVPTVVVEPAAQPQPAEPEPAPELDDGLARRLAEVEGLVARTAETVDRRAERVRAMLEQAVGIADGRRPK